MQCSGETPCSSCATKGQACEYNQEQDQRRKTGVKRKIDDLESQNSFLTNQLRVTQTELQQALRILRRLEDPGGLEESEDIDNADTATTEMSDVSLVKRKHVDELEEEYGFLRSIYDWIRESPRLSSMTVIDLIRDSANPGEAIRALTQQRFEESIHTWRKRHQTPPIMSLPPLFTRPPYLVPAKPWTTVTSNDGLVSHLLSLYFHWDYPIYHFLDRRLFLSDMAAGRTRFCSKMLVNAVLAHACVSFACYMYIPQLTYR